MCLHTTRPLPLIAEEDIKVYKVLCRHYTINNEEFFVGPYYTYYKYKKGYNYPVRADGEHYEPHASMIGYTIGKTRVVDAGWLHAYTNPDTPLNLYKHGLGTRIIAKMIVPKGATYYLSDDGEEICSDVLIWNE